MDAIIIVLFCFYAWIQPLGLKSAIILIKKMEDISISTGMQEVANFGEYKRVGEIIIPIVGDP